MILHLSLNSNAHFSDVHLLHASFRSKISSLNIPGEKLVNFMVEPKKGTKWPKELPKFKSRSDVIAVCKNLCSRQFMHRSEKVGKGELEVSRKKWCLQIIIAVACLVEGRDGSTF